MVVFFTWVESHPHTTTLITTLISVLLAIAGWFFVAWRNRKQEIEKIRLPLRVEMLKSAIVCLEIFKQSVSQKNHDKISMKECQKMILSINVEIQLIGKNKELKLWREFCDSLQKETRDVEAIKQAFIKLISLLRDNLRKELLLSKMKD